MRKSCKCLRAHVGAGAVFYVCRVWRGRTWCYYDHGPRTMAFTLAKHQMPGHDVTVTYDYGHDNDGARQLAYDLLTYCLKCPYTAQLYYRDFVREELAGWESARCHVICEDEILAWVVRKGGAA